MPQTAGHGGQPAGWNRFDSFMALNVAVLLGTLGYAYATDAAEFALYAAILLIPILAFWRVLRRYEYPVWLMVLLQVAMLAHFSGGLLYVDGVWLYAHDVAGLVRYDKLVHFVNTGIAAVFVMHLFRMTGLRLGNFEGFVVVMTAAGLGTLVEILEYVAVETLPRTGVGGYANNLQDLIANLLGAIAGWGAYRLLVSRSVLAESRP